MNMIRKNALTTILAVAVTLFEGVRTASAAPVTPRLAEGRKDNNYYLTTGPAVGYANKRTRTFLAFSVADIVSNCSVGLADFAEVDFDISFSTEDGTLLDAGLTYVVEYIGFASGDPAPWVSNLNYWQATFSSPTVSAVNTGVEDTLEAQSITASSFFLSDVTGITTNDYVTFRIHYNMTSGGPILQNLSNFELDRRVQPPPAGTIITIR